MGWNCLGILSRGGRMIFLLCSLMKTCFMGIVQHEFRYYARRLYHVEGRIGLVLVCDAK
jgi:hypothetical protein